MSLHKAIIYFFIPGGVIVLIVQAAVYYGLVQEAAGLGVILPRVYYADAVYMPIQVILMIISMIGLIRSRPYGWRCVMSVFVFGIAYRLYAVFFYQTSDSASNLGKVLFFYTIGIVYYAKRKWLFYDSSRWPTRLRSPEAHPSSTNSDANRHSSVPNHTHSEFMTTAAPISMWYAPFVGFGLGIIGFFGSLLARFLVWRNASTTVPLPHDAYMSLGMQSAMQLGVQVAMAGSALFVVIELYRRAKISRKNQIRANPSGATPHYAPNNLASAVTPSVFATPSFCTACGARLAPGAKFCAYCGSKAITPDD